MACVSGLHVHLWFTIRSVKAQTIWGGARNFPCFPLLFFFVIIIIKIYSAQISTVPMCITIQYKLYENNQQAILTCYNHNFFFILVWKVLKLGSAAMANTTTGNIVNLVSSDTQRFDLVRGPFILSKLCDVINLWSLTSHITPFLVQFVPHV